MGPSLFTSIATTVAVGGGDFVVYGVHDETATEQQTNFSRRISRQRNHRGTRAIIGFGWHWRVSLEPSTVTAKITNALSQWEPKPPI